MKFDETFVDALAPNASAIQNARSLTAKKKWVRLHISSDESVMFGECRGSGASNYLCSMDFLNGNPPLGRCSCPSRIFPCKHSLGLLYAYLLGGQFSEEAIPKSVVEARGKAQARVEKKAKESAKPRKVNLSALKKKLQVQLKGLDLLEALVQDIVQGGLGQFTSKQALLLQEQAKHLRDAYLPGVQSEVLRLLSGFRVDSKSKTQELSDAERERIYPQALDQLIGLQALCQQGRQYLQDRLDNPDTVSDSNSSIAALLGHAWKLSELKESGFSVANRELVQLAFDSQDDPARKEWVETGYWFELGSGTLRITQHFRPYSALKHIAEEDCCFDVLCLEELFVYPGQTPQRVRWESMKTRPITSADILAVRLGAVESISDLMKTVKNQMKSPLGEKAPHVLIRVEGVERFKEGYVLVNAQEERLHLVSSERKDIPDAIETLKRFPEKFWSGLVLFGRMRYEWENGQLALQPISLVTEREILRLLS